MKKLLISLLLLIMLAFSAVGCGEYKPIEPTEPPAAPPVQEPEKPVGGNDAFEQRDGVYSVRLIFDDGVLERNEETEAVFEGLEVQWSNGSSVHRASFDEDGVARKEGLDGDYAVTLCNLADTHRYNPNGNAASADDEDIEIEVFEYITTRGKGLSPSSPISVSRFGAYTVKLNKLPYMIYFKYKPTIAGNYIIETIEDATANSVNPIIKFYPSANEGGFVNEDAAYEINDGGYSAEYTKNAKLEVKLTADMVGNIFVFGIGATQREGVYPVNVTFRIKYAGEYNPPTTDKKVIIPDQEKLLARGMIGQPAGVKKFPETQITGSADYEFKLSNFGFNESDGLWHRVDEHGQPNGPILYASITRRTRFFGYSSSGDEVSFVNVEGQGSAALTLENGTETWKLFIEGGAAVADPDNPTFGLEGYGSYKGLADMIAPSNTDGVYPVTAEVKTFLQKYAVNQRYFNDGNGWAETTAEDEFGYRIFATEEAQWLFGVCYYE